MARSRFSVANFLYSLLGLAAVGVAAYYAYREVQVRRVESAQEHGGSTTMMETRRAARKIGRAAKDTAQDIGTDVKRGFNDASEAVQELETPYGTKKL